MPRKPNSQPPEVENAAVAGEGMDVAAAQAAMLALIPEVEQLAEKFERIFRCLLATESRMPEEGEEENPGTFFSDQLQLFTMVSLMEVRFRLADEVAPAVARAAKLTESALQEAEAANEKRAPAENSETPPKQLGSLSQAELLASLHKTELELATLQKELYCAEKGMAAGLRALIQDLRAAFPYLELLPDGGFAIKSANDDPKLTPEKKDPVH